MPNRPGWPQLGGNIPQFADDHLDSLREAFFDAHGVTPGPPLAIAALIYVADLASLEAALNTYAAECKRQGVKHG
jgi:hypothetical protein